MGYPTDVPPATDVVALMAGTYTAGWRHLRKSRGDGRNQRYRLQTEQGKVGAHTPTPTRPLRPMSHRPPTMDAPILLAFAMCGSPRFIVDYLCSGT
jgi:hypothetical protein